MVSVAQVYHMMVVTFDGLQVVHGQFEALSSPVYPHRVPLIIIEARTRKDGLWAFTCTAQSTVSSR